MGNKQPEDSPSLPVDNRASVRRWAIAKLMGEAREAVIEHDGQ